MGNNIPQGYKATALGIIPQEWEVKKVKDICNVDANSLTTKTPLTYEFEYISLSDVDSDSFEISTSHQIFQTAPSRARRIVKKGDVVISTVRPNLQGFFAIKENVKDLIASTGFVVLSPISCDTQYLLLYFYSEAISKQFYSLVVGSNYPSVNSSDVAKIKIAVPPLTEQQKIAEVLGVWDEAIEKQARLIEKLALRKRALMQRLLTGKLRLPNFNEEWRNTIFSSVIEKMSNGYTYDVNGVGNVPITRIETISKGIIDYSKVGNVLYVDELEKYKLHRGDILFSHINSIEHIGKVAIFEGDEDLYHGMNLLLIRTKEVMSNIYLYYFLSSPIAIRKVRSLAKKAVNQASISIAELKKLVIYIPEIKEQTAIAEVLTAADREIELAKEKLERLRHQKRGLMQQLLTGKKRIKF